MAGAVDEHNGLTGTGTAGDSRGAVVSPRDIRPLLRVQEDSPGCEVGVVDRGSQLLVVLNERELHLRGRVEHGGEQFVIFAGTCGRWRAAQVLVPYVAQ